MCKGKNGGRDQAANAAKQQLAKGGGKEQKTCHEGCCWPVCTANNTDAAGEMCLWRRRALAADRLRADLRGAAAAVSVHPRLGLGGAGGRCADLRRLGADFNLQEVRG